MLVLDHDRAGGYWGAVYVFTAIKGLQVVIDGPVGCENLPVTSVLHYTDALPPHELPIVVTGLAEEELGRHGTEAAMRRAHKTLDPDAAERGRHRLDRRDDRRRRDAGRHGPATLPAAHDRRGPMAVRQPRDAVAVDRVRPKKAPRRKAREPDAKPKVNIIGPSYGVFNMPSDLAEIRRLVEGIGAEVNHRLPARQPSRRRRRGWPTPTSTSACIASSAALLCEALDGPICRRRSACIRRPNSCATLGELPGLDPEPFIAREKHTTIKPIWDLWRSVTQDFFGTASFAIVANETYARGVRHFLEDELGLPCMFAVSRAAPARRPTTRRCASAIRDEDAAGHVRQLQRAHVSRRGRRPRRLYSRPRSRARSSAATPARRSWATPAPPI